MNDEDIWLCSSKQARSQRRVQAVLVAGHGLLFLLFSLFCHILLRSLLIALLLLLLYTRFLLLLALLLDVCFQEVPEEDKKVEM